MAEFYNLFRIYWLFQDFKEKMIENNEKMNKMNKMNKTNKNKIKNNLKIYKYKFSQIFFRKPF